MDENKIIKHFGEEFYIKVLNDLECYAYLWGLSDFNQVDYYSVNCIFKCFSEKYGMCILKIGRPSIETQTEYHTLREYNDSGKFCKVHEADINNGVLLIERVIPGTQLRNEPCLEKRLELFYELSYGLHIEPVYKTVYPTYLGWVTRITEYMSSRTDYKLLYEKMIEAEEICKNLCDKYPNEMLLHGDFHHDNILLDTNKQYRIIDPKGVIGDSVFDIPRFILNEFDDEHNEDFINKFTYITKSLSAKFNIPEYDVRCLTHVEMCMANCWNVESAEEPDIGAVLFTEKMMNKML